MNPRPTTLTTRKKVLFLTVLVAMGLAAGAVLALVGWRSGWLDPRWVQSRQLARTLKELRERPRRVLVVGDSFLSWWPIPCLNTELREWGDANNVGVLNAAQGGYGPLEYRSLVDRHLSDFQPGLVLVFYYVGNDLTDVLSRTDGQPRLATRLPGRQGPSLLAMLLGMLETTAHAAVPEGFKEFDWQAMLDHGIPADLIELGKARLNDLEDFQSGFINPYVLETAMVHPEFFRENLLIESDAAQIGWRHARRTLLDIFVRSREAGADVCLVVIPSTLQVSDSHYSLYERMLFDMDPRLLTTNRPQQLLADLCRQADVPIVDLLPAFREDPEDLYWLNDDHMSEKGHRLAWRVLREQYLDEWLARQTASADHP